MLLQQVKHRQRLAQPFAHGRRLLLRHTASGQQQVARPGFALRHLHARLERHVHLLDGQLKRDAVGHAHALEVEHTVAGGEVVEVLAARVVAGSALGGLGELAHGQGSGLGFAIQLPGAALLHKPFHSRVARVRSARWH